MASRYTKYGEDLSVQPEERKYVALQNLAFGDRIIRPGEIVPTELGETTGACFITARLPLSTPRRQREHREHSRPPSLTAVASSRRSAGRA